ncbi:hypothetical protein ACIQVT_06560 [Streptomyces sp. NPDC100445]|uniref:hypothetical protein n=1 Tax=Streptomyces sp. NPDC100445 TaxID=3366102 RepID=UPI0038077EAB
MGRIPGAQTHHEDPALEPAVHVHSPEEHVVPYEIQERVAAQVEHCRTAPERGDDPVGG